MLWHHRGDDVTYERHTRQEPNYSSPKEEVSKALRAMIDSVQQWSETPVLGPTRTLHDDALDLQTFSLCCPAEIARVRRTAGCTRYQNISETLFQTLIFPSQAQV